MRIPQSIGRTLGSIVLLAALLSTAKAEELTDLCQTIDWPMGRELALFRSSALQAETASTVANQPLLALDQLYKLELHPQGEVHLVRNQERTAHAPSPAAGLARFTATKAGKYRITVDAPVWIDIVLPSGIVPPSAYNGWHHCSIFRKSVEYILQTSQTVVLQLSDAPAPSVKIVVEAL